MTRNGLEIRVFGLQRSGNHAILFWIIDQFRGRRICFLNDVRHGDHDPFRTAAQIHSYGLDDVASDDLAQVPKDVLIYSYEDDEKMLQHVSGFFESARCERFEAHRQAYLGESDRRLDLIIHRDPFNFVASRLKNPERLTSPSEIPVMLRFWKEIAREAIAGERQPRADSATVFASFNRWCAEQDYRQRLSASLGGTFSDRARFRVSPHGGGSSFDGTAYDPLTIRSLGLAWRRACRPSAYRNLNPWKRLRGAAGMRVLDRWREFAEDPRFGSVLEDAEVMQLSRELFGELGVRSSHGGKDGSSGG